MIQPLTWIPLLALLTTVLLHALALRLFPKWNLLDFPERYGLKRRRLPYPTGILAVLVFILFFAMQQSTWTMQAIGLVVATILLVGTSFKDDRSPLPSWIRAAIQVLVALIIFATGTRIYTLTNPLDMIGIGNLIKLDTFDIMTPFFGPLPVWSGVFTICWIGLTVNALNWFDGIPGQVSGLSTIGFTIIGLLSLSYRVNQPELAMLAFILAGISLGCTLFDFPPNKVVIGDSGAMFFGLMLGVLTIYAGGKVATAFLVLGVPLIDSAIVVFRRLIKGNSIAKGNAKDEHLHHRLLAKGWQPQHIILLTLLLGSAFGVTALFLSTFEKLLAAGILGIIMLWLSWYSRP